MATTFRPYRPDQSFLLPPSLRDWLPEGHLVFFISDVVDRLNLQKFFDRYAGDGRRNAPYHPAMMVKVLIYAYAVGVVSSREMARRLETDVAFRVLAANNTPSHRTICRFRKEHLSLFSDLFMQVVKVAREAGLVDLGKLSIDGTKLRAKASKRKAMSYAYMEREEVRLRAEVDDLLAQAELADEAEDQVHGEHERGDELPAALASREDRASVVTRAVAEVEQLEAASTSGEHDVPAENAASDSSSADAFKKPEATSEAVLQQKKDLSATSALPEDHASVQAAAEMEASTASDKHDTASAVPDGSPVGEEIARRKKKLEAVLKGKAVLEARQEEADRAKGRTPDQLRNPKGGPPYKRAFGTPDPKSQYNFTDPESRIMKTSQDGFQQCYNMQMAIDAKHQLIVQTQATHEANDKQQLIPMLDAVEAAYGVQPETVLADSGYCSESNLAELEARHITGYVALGREGKQQIAVNSKKLPATGRMHQRLRCPQGDAEYRKRKWLSEAPNGWIKHVLGFRQFSVRGLAQVSGEWELLCLGLNLRRMAALQPQQTA